MIEKLLAMIGINPEQFQAQVERVQAEAVAVVKHFDAKTTALAEGQQHMALCLTTILENQRLIFSMIEKMGGDPVAHPVNGNGLLEHDPEFSVNNETQKETVQ